jgi:hypothetical protein
MMRNNILAAAARAVAHIGAWGRAVGLFAASPKFVDPGPDLGSKEIPLDSRFFTGHSQLMSIGKID